MNQFVGKLSSAPKESGGKATAGSGQNHRHGQREGRG
jgi:hypothetical protein